MSIDTEVPNPLDPNTVDLDALVDKYKKSNEEIEKLHQQTQNKLDEVNTLAKIINAYSGLKSTPEQKDPGKYMVAYYVWRKKPEECSCCRQLLPIIQTYHQTKDSPCGDTWEKTYNTYCPLCLTVTQVRDPEYSSIRF